jgi:predicted DNA-binding protein YlxM (UPF0122 family)
MSENSRRVNNFFKNANRADLQIITDDIIFSERQEKVMEMFYLKKKGINFIADTLNISSDSIKKDLYGIRQKIITKI